MHEIRPLFLLKKNVEKMMTDFRKSSTPDDWILRKTKNAETLCKIAEMIALYSDYFEREAHRLGFKVIRMDNQFEQRITEAMDLLMK